METLTLIVPVYNAPEMAARLVAHLPELAAVAKRRGYALGETLLVDDGSSPALDLPALPEDVRILRLPENCGKGSAVRAGALAAAGDWVLMSDVDMSAPLGEFSKLAAACSHDAWMVCASRWKRAGVPFVRRVLSFLFRFPVFLAGVRGMHDTQCGFKLFRMSRMRPLFEKLKTRRFAFDVELILGVQRAGGRVVETPVVWQGGRRSSLRVMRDAPRMLWDVMKMRFMR